MSKFYYSGSLEQVNYLSRRDLLLRLIYGKWQVMFAEGCLFILLAAAIAVVELFYKTLLLDYPALVAYGFAVLLGIMALLFFITILIVRSEEQTWALRYRAIADLIGAGLLAIFPGLLGAITGLITLFTGWYLLAKSKKPGGGYSYSELFQRGLAFAVVISGFALFFNTPYNNWILCALLVIAGAVILRNAWVFRHSITLYEDEQKGFTDYKIE